MPGETLGRFNVCPTEQVLAVCDAATAARRANCAGGSCRRGRASCARGPSRSTRARRRCSTSACSRRCSARADRRCLVIADGWYEWLRPERPRGERVPFRYTVDGGAPFAFAGLWDERRVDGERLASVTVLTTAANEVCAPVHDRMPCVLDSAEAEAAWLSPDVDAEAALELLTSARRGAHRRGARQPRGQQGRRRGRRAARWSRPRPEPVQLELGLSPSE